MGASKVQASLKHYGSLGKAGIENVGRKFPLLLVSTEAIFFTAQTFSLPDVSEGG
jgi:hypothetical protein